MTESLFLPFQAVGKAKPSIELPLWEGLTVLPYVRRRLVFAHVLAASLEREQFDLVRVDLPCFLNRSELLEISHGFFPHAFSLIIKWDSQRYFILSFVPNDAGYLATFAARRACVPYECVDDENLVFYPEGAVFAPSLHYPDDFWMYSQGVERYFAPLWTQMDDSWKSAPAIQKAYTEARAAIVACRLRDALRSGKRVLFVCEYRLWWAVKRALEEGKERTSIPIVSPESDLAGAFVTEDPPLLWAKGYLDDFPAVNLRFCQRLKAGDTVSFDKLIALDRLLSRFVSQNGRTTANGSSVRRLLKFRQYLRNLVVPSRRIIPLPVTHLLEGAKSCFGKDFARRLAEILIAYPEVKEDSQKEAHRFFVIGADGSLKPGQAFDVPDLTAAADYFGESPWDSGADPGNLDLWGRQEWSDLVRQRLTRAEQRYLAVPSTGMEWAVEADYTLYESACDLVKQHIARQARHARIQRSWGTLGDGIAWKATIAAKARGERAIYIKRLLNDLCFARPDEYTPFVFIFSTHFQHCWLSSTRDANLSQRRIWLGDKDFPYDRHPKPDSVYSLLRAIRGAKDALDGHLRQDRVAALVHVYNRSAMGVERYERIVRSARRYQCRVCPTSDVELRRFGLGEKVVAFAIKYAHSSVFVLAPHGWSLSDSLARYARKKQVRVVVLPLSILSPELVERLQNSYFISTPLKKHPNRSRILRRFIS